MARQQYSNRAARYMTGIVCGLLITSSLGLLPAYGQTTSTWNGGNGNWSTAADWTPNVAPNGNVNVLIDGGNAAASTVTLDINSSVNNLTINSDDGLSLNNGTALTVNGSAINNAGGLSLNSSGSNTDLIIGGSNVTFPGQLTMKPEPGFPEMLSKCATLPGKPGVPSDLLGADLPGGSTIHSKNVTFKRLPVGCEAGPAVDAPKPAAH